MSKIDDLLKTYCPNGVEYKPLLSVTNVLYGFPCDASKFNTDKQGQPLARIRDVLDGETSTYTTEIIPNKYKLKENDLLIGMDGNFHVSNWKMKDGILCQRVCKISSNDNECTVLNGFLSHLLKPVIKKVEDGKQSGTVKHLLDKDLKAIQIPVPPLEVQREIVQVLDSFTMLTAELSAELSARKKQYEYYRDQLLSFNNVRDGLTFANPESVRWMTLGEIATDIYRGSGITREQVTTSGIPCVRYGEIYTSYGIHFDKCISHTNLANIASPKYFEHGDILFAITGESIEDIAKSTAYVGNEKCLAGGDIVVLKHKQNPKYLSYALSTTDAIKQKGKGKVKSKVVHSSVPAISELKIPVPPIEIQNRIVKVLDNFDSICSDLQIGLPAEIDARKKQYEYYRDLLLSFEPIGTVLAKQASKQASKQSNSALFCCPYP